MEPAVPDQSQVLMEIDTSGQIRIPIDSKEVAHELKHQRVLPSSLTSISPNVRRVADRIQGAARRPAPTGRPSAGRRTKRRSAEAAASPRRTSDRSAESRLSVQWRFVVEPDRVWSRMSADRHARCVIEQPAR